MTLSAYHQNHKNRSDEELERRGAVKERELEKIFSESGFVPKNDPVRVAVTGCVDGRYVPIHKRIFEKLLGKPVELTTFDITTEHLAGYNGVVQHDVTTPFPNPPYDITFGHVLLKFIETEKQWLAIQESFNALRSGGIAIHVFDEEDVSTQAPTQKDGLYAVPLERWKKQLDEKGIPYLVIRWTMDIDEMPINIRGLKGGALVLKKP